MKQPKFSKGYKGWFGESCWKQRGKKFLKRLVRRSNRHFENSQIMKELSF